MFALIKVDGCRRQDCPKSDSPRLNADRDGAGRFFLALIPFIDGKRWKRGTPSLIIRCLDIHSVAALIQIQTVSQDSRRRLPF